MAFSNTTVAFSMPGGEASSQARSRPVDLVHLARQTMGDRALEQEVLGLFLGQAIAVREKIAGSAEPERLSLAHSLKGAAAGIGAFAIAECAGQIEQRPGDRRAITRLAALIDEVRDFIAAINR